MCALCWSRRDQNKKCLRQTKLRTEVQTPRAHHWGYRVNHHMHCTFALCLMDIGSQATRCTRLELSRGQDEHEHTVATPSDAYHTSEELATLRCQRAAMRTRSIGSKRGIRRDTGTYKKTVGDVTRVTFVTLPSLRIRRLRKKKVKVPSDYLSVRTASRHQCVDRSFGNQCIGARRYCPGPKPT